MANVIEAIIAIDPTKGVVVKNENIDTIEWGEHTPIPKADIEAKLAELNTAEANEKQAKIDLKASAKAKLIAGEALTEDEADTIVL